jgi:hypothetical protein
VNSRKARILVRILAPPRSSEVDSSPSEVEKTKLDQLLQEYEDIFHADLLEG